MRSYSVLLTAAVVAGAVGIASPADAAPPTPTAAIARSLPTAFSGADLTPCTGTNTGSLGIVSQTSGTHGTGAMRFAMGSNAGSDPYVFRDFGSSPVPAADFVLSFDVLKQGASAGASPFTAITVDDDGSAATTSDQHDLIHEIAPDSSTTWKTLAPTGGDPLMDVTATTDWPTWVNAHQQAVVLGYGIDTGCGDPAAPANSVLLLDNLTTSISPTAAKTFDFEEPSTIAASGTGTVIAGSARTLSATLRNGSTAVAGVALDVYAKAYGATTYTKVATTAVTSATGVATYSAKPVKTTSYQFRVADAGASHGAANSALLSVSVATKLTKNIYDTTVTTTQPVLAYGLTYPAKPGATVTLYRGTIAVASSKVAADGTYLIQGRITVKGKFALVVKGGAGTGNVAGASPATYVTVS